MRANNLALVMREVADSGPLSRAQIASRTGLTKSSVSGLIADLVDGRLASESVEAPAVRDRGRPGIAVKLAPDGAAGLGLEVAVDYLAAVVVDLAGSPRYRHVVSGNHRNRPADEVIGELNALAAEAQRASADQGLQLAGLCVAVPGPVTDGVVARAPNLGWRDVAVAPRLRSVLGDTAVDVQIENEANLAALGELWFGGHDNLRDFVHVSGEIGIGAGLVVDGELFRGAHARAGELGHVVVDPDGPECSCGGFGCLERLAGLQAILAAAGSPSLTSLVARCRDEDPDALAAVRTAGRRLGTALASVNNLLDPEAVVLGGAFVELAAWLTPAFTEALTRHSSGPAPRLLISSLGSDAAARGAAGQVIRRVLTDPAGYLAIRRSGAA